VARGEIKGGIGVRFHPLMPVQIIARGRPDEEKLVLGKDVL
jgi:hypothetical protein